MWKFIKWPTLGQRFVLVLVHEHEGINFISEINEARLYNKEIYHIPKCVLCKEELPSHLQIQEKILDTYIFFEHRTHIRFFNEMGSFCVISRNKNDWTWTKYDKLLAHKIIEKYL